METPAAVEPRAETAPAATAEVVLIRLGGCRYALPMPAVAEVGRPPLLTRVPGVPNWVAGVANWRGRVLAVLDLRPLLSAEARPLDRRGRLVVLTRNGVTAGLLTEGVEGTSDVDPDDVEPSLAHLPAVSGALISGQVTDAGGPVGVLDLEAVFGLADTLTRSRRAG
ncbi:MAG: purine-binding chemotaxis protein CheW [Frankiaceae bacterium]|nr:purine-binding chemotaxis protein CheW [Frankiaceae bacterium]